MTDFSAVVPAPPGRFDGIARPYSSPRSSRLRGSVPVEHSLARRGANRLWELLQTEDYVHALGAVTGNQAMQMVRAGLKAIYLSGWQVAADANTAGAMYPDQSLYPANAGPGAVPPDQPHPPARRPDRACRGRRARATGSCRSSPTPRPASAGPLNCFEIMKAYIEAGAAAVHFEDQLAAEKKCGHLGGKVLIPTQAHIRNLDAARLAADVCGVPTLRRRPHRRREREADHLRRRRARPRMADRRAHARRLLPPQRGHRSRPLHQARPRLRASCRPAVVGDEPPEPRRREALRRGDPERISGQDDGL